jgi:hypothetical protein
MGNVTVEYENGDCKKFPTVHDAYTAAHGDKEIWKISFLTSDGEEVRIVFNDKGEPIYKPRIKW